MPNEELKYGAIIVAVIGAATTIVVTFLNRPGQTPAAPATIAQSSTSGAVASGGDTIDAARSKLDALYAAHEQAFIRKDIAAVESIYTLDSSFTDITGKQQDLQDHRDNLIKNLANDDISDATYVISNIQASNGGYDVEWNEHIEWLQTEPGKKDRHQRTSNTKRLAHWITTDNGLLMQSSKTLSISTTTDGKPDPS